MGEGREILLEEVMFTIIYAYFKYKKLLAAKVELNSY
jgi:hypothetical protein